MAYKERDFWHDIQNWENYAANDRFYALYENLNVELIKN